MKSQFVLTSFKFIFLILISCFSLASCSQNKSTETAAVEIESERKDSTLYIKGRTLYTSYDEPVILRGVNEMFIWSDDRTGETILPEISKTGANAIRLVWATEGNPEELDLLISISLKYGMVPMVELHDATGDWSKLPIVMEYWQREDVKEVMNKYKKWVLLNIANEVGKDSDQKVFTTEYKNAITVLRNAGYTMPLVIDAPDWGKDEKIIAVSWKELFNHDPLKNTLFSVHTYWVDGPEEGKKRLDAFLEKVVSDTIPFLFGEGPQSIGWDCKTEFPYQYCIQRCEELGIGWLAWSWGAQPNDDCGDGQRSNFDMTTDGIFGNWNNDWGRLINVDDENSIKNTSVRPASLIKMMGQTN